MSMSRSEAAQALRDIDTTETRTRTAARYTAGSPYMLLWGCIWFVGYLGSALRPQTDWGMIWLPLIVIGVLGSILAGRRTPRSSIKLGQSGIMSVAIALFIAAIFTLFRIGGQAPYLAIPSMMVALVYTLFGVALRLWRFCWIGCGIFVAVMAAALLAPASLAYVLAIAGGGGLILGGLWLRRV